MGRPLASSAASLGGAAANEVARDHDALDLGGAVDDLEHLRERDEACERIIVEPPVGAERLAALDCGAQCGVRAEALGVGDRNRPSLFAEQLRRPPGQPSCRLEIGGDVGERPGDSLVRDDRLPENRRSAGIADATSSASAWRPFEIAAMSKRATSIAPSAAAMP